MIIDGPYLKATLGALKLESGQQRNNTQTNAENIVRAVILAYMGTPGSAIDPTHQPSSPVTGLVYGRIQSGKTRAMIASTALAFDNGFRISIVMTSNINDLVSQTHLDFTTGLQGVMTYTKDNDLDREVANVKVHLEMGDGRLLLVCSKGAGSLENISKFLKKIDAEKYPTIIFDDEGDQASLDTNTRKRSTGVAVAPSAINNIIQTHLRTAVSRHVYVGVTGTPQAVLLQSADSSHRPSFIEMLPPGSEYIGGDHFFDTGEPEENVDHLIEIVDQNEKDELLNDVSPIPDGLKRSILFFLVSAGSAIVKEGLPEKGYSYLCHPSLKNNEQGKADARINDFLTKVTQALFGTDGGAIVNELQTAYEDLKVTLGNDTPDFESVKDVIKTQLATRRILVINAKVKRQGIAYGRGLNFLIGGNTLGRGIAVKSLLVTYYIRDSKVSQIDTMHQHARMYGYRKATLKYTRLFIPRHLYYRFRDIHDSDKDLRTFINDHKAQLPGSFPIEYTYDLRTTRTGVLDVNKLDTLRPRMHVFPNYVIVPQDPNAYQRVLAQVRHHLGLTTETEKQMATVGQGGVEITTEQAVALAKSIKTHSKNTWRDKSIAAVLEKVASHFNGKIMLKFRTADRTVDSEGFFSTGAVSGPELTQARDGEIPTLWVMAVTTKTGSAAGADQRFVYPTFIIPSNFPKLFMFNRG